MMFYVTIIRNSWVKIFYIVNINTNKTRTINEYFTFNCGKRVYKYKNIDKTVFYSFYVKFFWRLSYLLKMVTEKLKIKKYVKLRDHELSTYNLQLLFNIKNSMWYQNKTIMGKVNLR